MFSVFLDIAEQLNTIGIKPLLMGSVGLEQRTGQDWQARDLDIHVPGDPRGWEVPDDQRIYQFQAIHELMTGLGYDLVDRHEHEYRKNDLSVEFGVIDTLPDFAGIALADLEEQVTAGVRYYLPSLEQYLAIYRASSKDSYRSDQNNHKDLLKIAYLTDLLEQ